MFSRADCVLPLGPPRVPQVRLEVGGQGRGQEREHLLHPKPEPGKFFNVLRSIIGTVLSA